MSTSTLREPSTRLAQRSKTRGRGAESRRLKVVLATIRGVASAVLVVALSGIATGTTVAGATTFTYDVPAIARVAVFELDAVQDGSSLLGGVRGWSDLPSVKGRGASTTLPRSFIATEAAGVGRVNAVGGTHNCVSCAIAGDSTLAGNPASALNLHPGVPIPGGNAAIEAYAGASWRSVAGQSAIESELLAAGNGARGIVYGTNGKTAHVWNAVVQDGNVNFVDFQGIGPSGSAAFDGWTKFAFVRTG
jgi:hypothetical protein